MTETIFTTLLSTASVMLSGNYVILYRYQRWHLIKVRNGRLRMLHFMTEEQAQKMIRNWRTNATAKPIEQVSEQFAADLSARVLEKAESYLAFLEAGKVEILGFDASIQYPEIITDTKNNFLSKVSKMMETGRSGLYLCFADE